MRRQEKSALLEEIYACQREGFPNRKSPYTNLRCNFCSRRRVKLGESKHSGSSLCLCALLSLACQEKGHLHSRSIAADLLFLHYPTERIDAVEREICTRVECARVFVYDKLNIYILRTNFCNASIALIYLESRTENQTTTYGSIFFNPVSPSITRVLVSFSHTTAN